jgi:hypothetical protein
LDYVGGTNTTLKLLNGNKDVYLNWVWPFADGSSASAPYPADAATDTPIGITPSANGDGATIILNITATQVD